MSPKLDFDAIAKALGAERRGTVPARGGTVGAAETLVAVREIQATLGVDKTCQHCLKRHESTKSRKVYAKGYMGPCADSFCATTCTSSQCWPDTMTICDDCEKVLSHPRTTP